MWLSSRPAAGLLVAAAVTDGVRVVAAFADDSVALDVTDHVPDLVVIALTAAPAVTDGAAVEQVRAATLTLVGVDGHPAGPEHLAGALLPTGGGVGRHLTGTELLELAGAGIAAQLTAGVAAELTDPAPDDLSALDPPAPRSESDQAPRQEPDLAPGADRPDRSQ